ncbi:hypothetical protein TNCV_645001 [Trichonephila clavipes]|nr:hypothetical protein TNCV_645001 [Trichonephila clavipes]
MLVVHFVYILGWSVLSVDDAGVVIQWYPTRARLETNLVISQVKATCQYSVEHVVLQQCCDGVCYSVGKLSLENSVHEWQCYRLNNQTDVQIFSQVCLGSPRECFCCHRKLLPRQ